MPFLFISQAISIIIGYIKIRHFIYKMFSFNNYFSISIYDYRQICI